MPTPLWSVGCVAAMALRFEPQLDETRIFTWIKVLVQSVLYLTSYRLPRKILGMLGIFLGTIWAHLWWWRGLSRIFCRALGPVRTVQKA